MTDNSEDWSEIPYLVAVGQRMRATILRVDRWGLLLDLGLPFKGFMDRLHIGNDLDRYHAGDGLDVVVVQLAEYNHQIRVRPLTDAERERSLDG